MFDFLRRKKKKKMIGNPPTCEMGQVCCHCLVVAPYNGEKITAECPSCGIALPTALYTSIPLKAWPSVKRSQ